MVSTRDGWPGSATRQTSWSDVVTWIALGSCALVLAEIAASCSDFLSHLGAVGLLVRVVVLIGGGVAARRRGWRQLASYVVGIVGTVMFVLAALWMVL